MAYTFEQVRADARTALDRDAGPEGCEVVARHLETLRYRYDPANKRVKVLTPQDG